MTNDDRCGAMELSCRERRSHTAFVTDCTMGKR